MTDSPPRLRLAILISGAGSNMVAIARACAEGRIDATVAVVISDNPGAGGLERAICLQKLPEQMREHRITLTRRIPVRAKGDTRLFIRLQQEDGHRAWSSPIYLFRR